MEHIPTLLLAIIQVTTLTFGSLEARFAPTSRPSVLCCGMICQKDPKIMTFRHGIVTCYLFLTAVYAPKNVSSSTCPNKQQVLSVQFLVDSALVLSKQKSSRKKYR